MSQEHDHAHEHAHEHEHRPDHGHDHDHDADHAAIVERLPEGVWRVDPHGSEVLFKARAFGFLPVTVLFEELSGEMSVDAGGAARGQLVVKTGSLNSGWGRRDATLRGASYFDSARHPEMIFTLDLIRPSRSEHMDLSGSLTIHDTPVPLSFPVYAIAHRDHLHLEGEVMIDHDPAGLGWSRPFYVGSRVRLEAALTLMRAESDPTSLQG